MTYTQIMYALTQIHIGTHTLTCQNQLPCSTVRVALNSSSRIFPLWKTSRRQMKACPKMA